MFKTFSSIGTYAPEFGALGLELTLELLLVILRHIIAHPETYCEANRLDLAGRMH